MGRLPILPRLNANRGFGQVMHQGPRHGSHRHDFIGDWADAGDGNGHVAQNGADSLPRGQGRLAQIDRDQPGQNRLGSGSLDLHHSAGIRLIGQGGDG